MNDPFSISEAPPKVVSIMVDLETLGLDTRTAPILQLGACIFNIYCPLELAWEEYELRCSLHENIKVGRKAEKQTIEWWNTQDNQLRKSLMDPSNSVTFPKMLFKFNDWVRGIKNEAKNMGATFNIWSKDAVFDLEMLTHAMEDHGIATAWNFRETKNVRTIIPSFPFCDPGLDKCKAHDAVYDAKYQAIYLENIQKRMKAQGVHFSLI